VAGFQALADTQDQINKQELNKLHTLILYVANNFHDIAIKEVSQE
jgi:hypothetical protein